DGISIIIKHKDTGSSNHKYECYAAANAVLRLILETYVNKNPVVNVRVPEDSFNDVVQGFRNLNCQDHEPVVDGHLDSAINIFVQTDPNPDQKQALYYL